MEELLRRAKTRVFIGELNIGRVEGVLEEGKPTTFLRDGAADLLTEQAFPVGGRVGGQEMANSFQVDLERWKAAISKTKTGEVLVNVVTVANLGRSDVAVIVGTLQQAEGMRASGQLSEAVAKVREIPTWAGYKPAGQSDRYAKLKQYTISDAKANALAGFLDFIWVWTASGHHTMPGGSSKFSDEQAKVAIDSGYLFLSFVSRQEFGG